MSDLQTVAHFALDLALAAEGAVRVQRRLPAQIESQRIVAGGVDPSAQADLTERRFDVQGVDVQTVGGGTALELSLIHI